MYTSITVNQKRCFERLTRNFDIVELEVNVMDTSGSGCVLDGTSAVLVVDAVDGGVGRTFDGQSKTAFAGATHVNGELRFEVWHQMRARGLQTRSVGPDSRRVETVGDIDHEGTSWNLHTSVCHFDRVLS